jgi:hypothetical protein
VGVENVLLDIVTMIGGPFADPSTDSAPIPVVDVAL